MIGANEFAFIPEASLEILQFLMRRVRNDLSAANIENNQSDMADKKYKN